MSQRRKKQKSEFEDLDNLELEYGLNEKDPRERYYRFGKKVTIYEQEKFGVKKSNGKINIVEGPKSMRPVFSELEKLRLYQCSADQYLEVEYVDGSKEHFRGPQAMHLDKLNIKRIKICESEKLEANEAIIVYREIREDSGRRAESRTDAGGGGKGSEGRSVPVANEMASRVERRIVRGPVVFIPASNEWVHEFSWHGAITERGGSKTGYAGDTKVAHACEFTKLRIMPDHMYLTVRDVRTKDDAKVTLHLMLYFVLEDIDTMLDNTNDPLGEFMNAAGADMMSFGADRTYTTLLEESYLLNDKEYFPILSGRMPSIGYKLLKVVYRGYDTSEKLQKLQDQKVAQRTQFMMTIEAEKQAHEKIKADLTRVETENALKEKKAAYEREKRQLLEEEERDRKNELHRQKLTHEKEMAETKLEIQRKNNQERLAYLESLKSNGVDLTAYLVAQESSRPTEHFLIENRGSAGSANIHLNKKK